MKQSINHVADNTQTPVGEREKSLSTNTPPLVPTLFTKVDKNLTGIGFFTASSKRSRKAVEKTTVVVDAGVERRISILPSAKYGLPITQDQDFWLALMKLVSEYIQREGKLINPFTFTTAQLQHLLTQTDAGKNYKAVQDWLFVMTSTTIEGGAYNTVKKKWIVEGTHAVDRIVTMGKELPDGRVADKHYIWFSEWQLDNINSGKLVPVEFTIYNQLNNNIAKTLIPHLQEWLFASQGDETFEKQYEDICQLLGIRAYRYISDIQRKLGPSLDELSAHGYISKWAIKPLANNRKAYKVVLWHGPKFYTDRQLRQSQKQRLMAPRAPEPAAPPELTPQPQKLRQANLKLVPHVDEELLFELTKRGVSDSGARHLLTTLPAERPILDLLEWIDYEIATRGNIKNPGAFIRSELQRNEAPPANFVSRGKAEEIRLANEAKEQDRIRHELEASDQEETETAALDLAIDAMNPADRLNLKIEAEAILANDYIYRSYKGNPHHQETIEKLIRRQMRQQLKDRLVIQPQTEALTIEAEIAQEAIEPAPAEPTQPAAELTAPTSQISTPATIEKNTFLDNLKIILATPQLALSIELPPDHKTDSPSSRPLQENLPETDHETIKTHLL